MATIDQICDYIILRMKFESRSADLNHLKIQKLLYYSQAWHLAFYDKELFDGKFQAWIHGPVNRHIYNRFKDAKYMYSNILLSDVKDMEVQSKLTEDERVHVNAVLETYAPYSSTQLEIMTHKEAPWLDAREGYDDNARCEEEISEKLMRDYYKKRLDS